MTPTLWRKRVSTELGLIGSGSNCHRSPAVRIRCLPQPVAGPLSRKGHQPSRLGGSPRVASIGDNRKQRRLHSGHNADILHRSARWIVVINARSRTGFIQGWVDRAAGLRRDRAPARSDGLSSAAVGVRGRLPWLGAPSASPGWHGAGCGSRHATGRGRYASPHESSSAAGLPPLTTRSGPPRGPSTAIRPGPAC